MDTQYPSPFVCVWFSMVYGLLSIHLPLSVYGFPWSMDTQYSSPFVCVWFSMVYRYSVSISLCLCMVFHGIEILSIHLPLSVYGFPWSMDTQYPSPFVCVWFSMVYGYSVSISLCLCMVFHGLWILSTHLALAVYGFPWSMDTQYPSPFVCVCFPWYRDTQYPSHFV